MVIASMLAAPPDELGIVAVVVAVGLVIAGVGWAAWTGRWRSWSRQGSMFDSVVPQLLWYGLAGVCFAGASLVGGLLQRAGVAVGPGLEAALGAVAVAGLLLLGWSALATWFTSGARATYERSPDGNRVMRVALPRWYQRELRERWGGARAERPAERPDGPRG